MASNLTRDQLYLFWLNDYILSDISLSFLLTASLQLESFPSADLTILTMISSRAVGGEEGEVVDRVELDNRVVDRTVEGVRVELPFGVEVILVGVGVIFVVAFVEGILTVVFHPSVVQSVSSSSHSVVLFTLSTIVSPDPSSSSEMKRFPSQLRIPVPSNYKSLSTNHCRKHSKSNRVDQRDICRRSMELPSPMFS